VNHAYAISALDEGSSFCNFSLDCVCVFVLAWLLKKWTDFDEIRDVG